MAIFVTLVFIICILLILIVLIQNSKGGGLAAGFSASNQIMGVRRTADFLEKATWWLAGGLLFLCLMASVTIPKISKQDKKSAIEEQINPQAPNAVPAFPAQPQPATTNSPDAKKTEKTK